MFDTPKMRCDHRCMTMAQMSTLNPPNKLAFFDKCLADCKAQYPTLVDRCKGDTGLRCRFIRLKG